MHILSYQEILLTIELIDHQAYQPLVFFHDFSAFRLVAYYVVCVIHLLVIFFVKSN